MSSNIHGIKPILFVRLHENERSSICHHTLKALLDSGSERTLIKKDLLNPSLLPRATEKHVVWSTVSGASRSVGKLNLRLSVTEVNGEFFEWPIYVASGLGGYAMIIGRDLLWHLGITLDFRTLTVHLNGHCVSFRNDPDYLLRDGPTRVTQLEETRRLMQQLSRDGYFQPVQVPTRPRFPIFVQPINNCQVRMIYDHSTKTSTDDWDAYIRENDKRMSKFLKEWRRDVNRTWKKWFEQLIKNLKTIATMAPPTSSLQVASFLGMCNYIRSLQKQKALTPAALTSLTKINTQWNWGQAQARAFHTVKRVTLFSGTIFNPTPRPVWEILADIAFNTALLAITRNGAVVTFLCLYMRELDSKTKIATQLWILMNQLREFFRARECNVHMDHLVKSLTESLNEDRQARARQYFIGAVDKTWNNPEHKFPYKA